MQTQITNEPTKTNNAVTVKAQTPTYVVTPLLDVYESADGLRVFVDLPGVTAEGLSLDLEEDVLTLVAKREPFGRDRAIHYKRRFMLPREVAQDRIEAKLQDGVLVLDLPKRAESKPRKISVTVG
ncbi:MAG: Hsp20/alpha crystallin family protein [Myxococcales bacterium]|nr:Hsp20/alpha crystallin family protein [Myxococcales bacterium]